MLYKAKVAVCSDIRTKHSKQSEHHVELFNVNPLSTKLYLSDLKTQFVPRSKLSASVIQTSQLMLYREIIAVCSQTQAKHINAL